MRTTRGACCVGWGRPSRRRRGWRGAPSNSPTRSNKKRSIETDTSPPTPPCSLVASRTRPSVRSPPPLLPPPPYPPLPPPRRCWRSWSFERTATVMLECRFRLGLRGAARAASAGQELVQRGVDRRDVGRVHQRHVAQAEATTADLSARDVLGLVLAVDRREIPVVVDRHDDRARLDRAERSLEASAIGRIRADVAGSQVQSWESRLLASQLRKNGSQKSATCSAVLREPSG